MILSFAAFTAEVGVDDSNVGDVGFSVVVSISSAVVDSFGSSEDIVVAASFSLELSLMTCPFGSITTPGTSSLINIVCYCTSLKHETL